MNTVDNLIELRILINSICDGFCCDNLNKNLSLSTKTKILFLLRNRDLSPSEITNKLCIAKTNLANLLKVMMQENLIVSYKNLDNSKNIFYRITNLGLLRLKDYENKLDSFLSKNFNFNQKITESINDVIHFLKGEKND